MTIRGNESSLNSSASVILWVEDELTQSYLSVLWEYDPSFRINMAASKNAVRAIVAEMRKDAHARHFGLVDRDFQASNKASWSDLTKDTPVFVLPVFEVENYLLDPAAIEGCALNTHKRESGEIKVRMRNVARKISWWIVCCEVISELREDFFGEFPKHPTVPSIAGPDDAVEYIAKSIWIEKLAARTAIWTEEAIRGRLSKINTELQNRLVSGDGWLVDIPGKEVFRDMQGWVYKAIPGKGGAVSDLGIDLAKAIGEWQVKNQSVPADLQELRHSLRIRVGLAR